MAHRILLYVFALMTALGFSGCSSKKGFVKDDVAGASDAEKQIIAMKLFKEGAELLYQDDQAALTKFDQAREVDPTLIPAHFNAGVALVALGQLDDALIRYEACLAQDRQQAACFDNWVVVKAHLQQFDDAEARVEQYLLEFPEAPFAMVSAAKLALIRADYSRAERYARLAIEREAENVEALFVMARIFYERKQYPAAKWVLKNALEVAPAHGNLHLLLGHTESALGLLHDALDSYALAVKAEPNEEALESYGLLLLKRGRVVESLPILKRLAELRPNQARHHLHLGNAYMANKMFDEAKSSYLVAVEKNPDDLDVNFNLGLLYFDLKPKELAEIDRLKMAKSYFEAYLKKTGLSKDRQAEVKEYLRLVNQKIEMEEYAAESAKAAAEEATDEEEEPQEEENQPPKEKPELDEKIESQPVVIPPGKVEEKQTTPVEEEKDSKKKPKEEPKKKDELDGLDDETDDFFDEL